MIAHVVCSSKFVSNTAAQTLEGSSLQQQSILCRTPLPALWQQHLDEMGELAGPRSIFGLEVPKKFKKTQQPLDNLITHDISRILIGDLRLLFLGFIMDHPHEKTSRLWTARGSPWYFPLGPSASKQLHEAMFWLVKRPYFAVIVLQCSNEIIEVTHLFNYKFSNMPSSGV